MPATIRTLLVLSLAFLFTPMATYGQGMFLTGVGAVNRSMGGASTAAPLDALGAIHWNPAAISGLQHNEASFSAEVLLLDQEFTHVTGGVPSSAAAESGVAAVPAFGWVHHMEGTQATIGLGMYVPAGFSQNLPMNPAVAVGHPVNASPVYSEAQFFQIVPTFALAVTDRLSIGFAPTLNLGKIIVDPAFYLGAGVSGNHTRMAWGVGAQVGAYYLASDTVHLGMSIKSPTWFEEFRNHTAIGGVPGVNKLKLDLPMIISLGMAYTGICDTTLALDVRYWDYKNTDGFGRPGPGAGSPEFQWGNVFSVGLGVQRRLNDCFYVRGGYVYNTSPIDDSSIGLNFASPLIQQHVASVGASYHFSENVDLTMSYIHLFDADQQGPSLVPGSTSSNQVAAYSLAAQVTVRYGG